MPETSELMSRPSERDDLVFKRTLELFMPSVEKYLGNDWIESERSYIEKQMREVLKGNRDGYGMARELERKGWEEDRDLVDLMDEGESCLRKAHKELTTQWIRTYGIAPSRGVGDKVSTTNWHRKGQVGVVIKIYEDEAKYVVQFPAQTGQCGQILEYEEVKDAPVMIIA